MVICTHLAEGVAHAAPTRSSIEDAEQGRVGRDGHGQVSVAAQVGRAAARVFAARDQVCRVCEQQRCVVSKLEYEPIVDLKGGVRTTNRN